MFESLVLCSPLHESTRGLFDEKLLRSMKKVTLLLMDMKLNKNYYPETTIVATCPSYCKLHRFLECRQTAAEASFCGGITFKALKFKVVYNHMVYNISICPFGEVVAVCRVPIW